MIGKKNMNNKTNCLFCRIVSKEISATIVYDDDTTLAFEDINPKAPTHILVIPKKHLTSLNEAKTEDEPVLGHLQKIAARLARDRGIDKSGFRTIVNTGPAAGQSVLHIHLHLLGGRSLAWPPG